jgi:hypothetical protein
MIGATDGDKIRRADFNSEQSHCAEIDPEFP